MRINPSVGVTTLLACTASATFLQYSKREDVDVIGSQYVKKLSPEQIAFRRKMRAYLKNMQEDDARESRLAARYGKNWKEKLNCKMYGEIMMDPDYRGGLLDIFIAPLCETDKLTFDEQADMQLHAELEDEDVSIVRWIGVVNVSDQYASCDFTLKKGVHHFGISYTGTVDGINLNSLQPFDGFLNDAVRKFGFQPRDICEIFLDQRTIMERGGYDVKCDGSGDCMMVKGSVCSTSVIPPYKLFPSDTDKDTDLRDMNFVLSREDEVQIAEDIEAEIYEEDEGDEVGVELDINEFEMTEEAVDEINAEVQEEASDGDDSSE